MSTSECVKVMVRVRPMNSSETQRKCSNIVKSIDLKLNQIVLQKPNEADVQKVFTYDSVFDQNSLQEAIYEQSAFPLVEAVFEGYNGTIFAYGQTGQHLPPFRLTTWLLQSRTALSALTRMCLAPWVLPLSSARA